MDINTLLKGFVCDCGKEHKCDIENVFVENGAINRLTKLCEKYSKILLVGDENTFAVAGEKTEKALNGKVIGKVIFSGKTVVIPNEQAIETVNSKLGESDLIIGIGSGVMQDLCKYISHFSKIPYMVVATAPSMDGYASDGAAMILGGMKVTVKACLPRAIVADTAVLKDAPMDMIQAGYGDIIGKYSALNDWKLSKIVNGEYFCQFIYDTTYQMIQNTLKTAEGLLERNEESVKAIMEALVIVGVMMSFATSSRPASGSEHHLSHFFEIVGIIDDKPYFAHGIDVAYSTVITAGIREKVASIDFPKTLYKDDRDSYVAKMRKVYKNVGDSCVELQDKVGNYAKDRTKAYLDNEKELKAVLKECPTAKEIEKMLNLVKMDMKEFYDMYGKEKIDNAVKYAKDLKDRYSVLWMNYDFFGDND